jgi:hypothetical protein
MRPERSAAESTECARSVLNSFIAAFNRGDAAQLSTFFGAAQGAPAFRWFVTPETPAYGPGRAQLPGYFTSWHGANQRWRLVFIGASASPGWDGGVHFEMQIERAWPDRSTINGGKGALDCDAGKIYAFVLGDPVR